LDRKRACALAVKTLVDVGGNSSNMPDVLKRQDSKAYGIGKSVEALQMLEL
jgi:hypothetical protein